MADADYVYLYNDARYPSNPKLGVNGVYSEGVVEFATTGIPYYYDAWTGQQTPILNYTRSSSPTAIIFQLAGNQSTVIAFLSKPLDSDYPSEHLTSYSKGVLGTTYDSAKVSSSKLVLANLHLQLSKHLTVESIRHLLAPLPLYAFQLDAHR
jgi:hypothetical protein